MTAADLAAASDYGPQKGWAVLITVVLVVLVAGLLITWRARRRAARIHPESIKDDAAQKKATARKARLEALGAQPGAGVLFGADNRISTSHTVAFAWTVVVVYVITALLLTWPPDWEHALHNLYPTYFLLLGGPYAALILSKAIVSNRVTSGTLTKTSGDGTARISDLVGNDAGRTDLFDSQFVLFNIVAMWFVIAAFVRATFDGFPAIPNGLALLTGGPAAVYLANKLFGSTDPGITAVEPTRVTAGDPFAVRGTNLLLGQLASVDDASSGTVLVGGRTAPSTATDWTDTRIAASAPDVGTLDGQAVDVQVTTPGGGTAVLRAALTIDCRPQILGFNVSSAAPGQQVTMTVDWPAATRAGSAALIRLGPLAVTGPVVSGSGRSSLTFSIPDHLTDDPAGNAVPVTVRASGPESTTAELLIRGS